MIHYERLPRVLLSSSPWHEACNTGVDGDGTCARDSADGTGLMSQKSVEILLGKLVTDEAFRRCFFPVQASSFQLAAAHDLELTPVECHALSTLQQWPFDLIAQCLDPRLALSPSERRDLPDDVGGNGGRS
jgi:hypothetical protein